MSIKNRASLLSLSLKYLKTSFTEESTPSTDLKSCPNPAIPIESSLRCLLERGTVKRTVVLTLLRSTCEKRQVV